MEALVQIFGKAYRFAGDYPLGLVVQGYNAVRRYFRVAVQDLLCLFQAFVAVLPQSCEPLFLVLREVLVDQDSLESLDTFQGLFEVGEGFQGVVDFSQEPNDCCDEFTGFHWSYGQDHVDVTACNAAVSER